MIEETGNWNSSLNGHVVVVGVMIPACHLTGTWLLSVTRWYDLGTSTADAGFQNINNCDCVLNYIIYIIIYSRTNIIILVALVVNIILF